MAAITATSMLGPLTRVVSVTTLGASDTLTYNKNKKPILIINNVTVGSVTPNIDGGTAPAAYSVQGVGTIDLTSGFTFPAMSAGVVRALPLESIEKYLSGTITITGASGAEAMLLEY